VAERFAAEAAASAGGHVTYVATVQLDPDDHDLAERIRVHRSRRPPEWTTIEPETGHDLTDVVRDTPGTLLLDSLGPAVATHTDLNAPDLCLALTHRDGDTVVVSEEVGLSVHPETETGRLFRDDLGTLNQAVAAVADEVLLVVAGRTLRLDAPS